MDKLELGLRLIARSLSEQGSIPNIGDILYSLDRVVDDEESQLSNQIDGAVCGGGWPYSIRKNDNGREMFALGIWYGYRIRDLEQKNENKT